MTVRTSLALTLALTALATTSCREDDEPGLSEGEACTTEAQCRADLVCLTGACAASAAASSACAPPGAVEAVAGEVVGPTDPVSVCSWDVRTAASSGEAHVQPLGQRNVGTTASFDVPPGTWSITIISQEVGTTAVEEVTMRAANGRTVRVPNSVVPTDVRAPDGRTIYDDAWLEAPPFRGGYPDFSPLLGAYLGLTPTSGALTIPNTTAGLDLVRSVGQLPPGTWTFTVNDYALECARITGCTGASTAGVYDVTVITRPGPIASTGTLDLEIYLVSTDPALGISSAAEAAANPQMQRFVHKVGERLSAGGLCLGAVTIHDVPEWMKDRFFSVNLDDGGACGDLSQLFTLSGAPSRGIHLFLVDDLTASDVPSDYQLRGVDGSIPGPSGMPGTINSGAVVGLFGGLGYPAGGCTGPTSLATCGTDELAYVAAHEIGHWLGLYHTTEATGDGFDTLDDTGTCAAECGAGGLVTPPDCDQAELWCGGGTNLMFWTYDRERSIGRVSPQQGEVMRANGAVR